jgi:hypothetical protein
MSPAGVPDQLVASYGSDGNVTAIFVVARMSDSMAAAVMRFHPIVSNAIRAASADEGGRVSSCMFDKAKRAAQGVVAGAELLHEPSRCRIPHITDRRLHRRGSSV